MKSKFKIKVIDDFLPPKDYHKVVNFCKSANYVWGEKDRENAPHTGMVCNLNLKSNLTLLFHNSIIKDELIFKNLHLYRCYINCFSPSENPFFHQDGIGITCLYYPTENYSYDDCGETQFIIDDEIKGILPFPNRMVIFDATLLHRATSFRNNHRFTVAIKYGPNNLIYN